LNRVVPLAAAAAIVSLLLSCGGGGGGDTATGAGTNGVAMEASTYAGDYVDTCEPIPDGRAVDTGAALYATSVLSVGLGTGASAQLVLRFDFFDNAICSGQPIGTLKNSNTSNTLTLVSVKTIDGRPAHRVILNFGVPSATYRAGPDAATVIYGSALPLQLPSVLFTGFGLRDLWSLNGNRLFEGDYTYDAEGFPTGLLATPAATWMASAPNGPEAPCAFQTLNWTANGQSCVGLGRSSASRASQIVVSTPNTGSSGSATFTCNNGTWSAPSGASCSLATPSFTMCPVQTITWTSGSTTCSSETPVTIAGNDISIVNNLVGKTGGQRMSCRADGTWAPWAGVTGYCVVTPPPTTDPLQLAQAKNCLNCHTVSDPGYTFGPTGYNFPSFQAIANFYRNSPPAPGVLENRVKSGSTGTFGSAPMPANPQVDDADLAILIPWILSR
jgi:cytochrome c